MRYIHRIPTDDTKTTTRAEGITELVGDVLLRGPQTTTRPGTTVKSETRPDLTPVTTTTATRKDLFGATITTTTEVGPGGSTITTRTHKDSLGTTLSTTTTTEKGPGGTTTTVTYPHPGGDTTTYTTFSDGTIIKTKDGSIEFIESPPSRQPAPPDPPKEAQAPPQPADTPELPGLDDIIKNAPIVIS